MHAGVSVFTFAQGCGFTLGVANRKSQLWWVTFTLPLKSLILYEGTPFVTWHVLPHILLCSNSLSPSLSLEMHVSFLQHNVSQHQLNCACSFIIIALLLVCFAVGLVLGLSISLFEALLHLFHISGDMTVTCICTNHWEEKVYWEARSPPKHEVVGWVPHDSRSEYCCRPAEVQGDVVPIEPSCPWPTFQSSWTEFGEIFPPVHCIAHGMQ